LDSQVFSAHVQMPVGKRSETLAEHPLAVASSLCNIMNARRNNIMRYEG
jgi:hypothetical protein